jgi:DNA-binding LytR/AlgR family response regulator
MQQFFYVRREKRYEQVNFSDIIYVKAKKGYIQIVTEQKTYLIMNTMAVIQKYLPDELFCRIHHSFIVALSRVKAFDRLWVWLHEAPEDQPYKLGLARVTELPVGFRYRSKLRASVSIMMNKSGSYHKKIKEMEFELEGEEME